MEAFYVDDGKIRKNDCVDYSVFSSGMISIYGRVNNPASSSEKLITPFYR